jgi:hypothetical protein
MTCVQVIVLEMVLATQLKNATTKVVHHPDLVQMDTESVVSVCIQMLQKVYYFVI